MKQGKAINGSRLFQPNRRNSKVDIIDTTTRGKKRQNVTTYCELVRIKSTLFL